MSIEVIFSYFASLFFLRENFVSQKFYLVLYPHSFLVLSIFPQLACYLNYHNYPGIHCFLTRCSVNATFMQMVSLVLKNQDVLIYDVNSSIDFSFL